MNIQEFLDSLGIAYTRYEHPAIFTVQEAEKYERNIPGAHTKNLFLCDEKHERHYLIVIDAHKRADLKKIAHEVGEKRLTFARTDELMHWLKLTPGSVTPFGLIYDTTHHVIVMVDSDLLAHELVGFHPNINTATLVLSSSDFKKFLTACGIQARYCTL